MGLCINENLYLQSTIMLQLSAPSHYRTTVNYILSPSRKTRTEKVSLRRFTFSLFTFILCKTSLNTSAVKCPR